MEVLQFSALVMFALLTMELAVLLPHRVVRDPVQNRSRWLMAIGVMVLALQFLIQYIFGFRSKGVTQAVMVNLLFFVPCSSLFSLALLNLQQQGRLMWQQWLVALVATLSVWVIIVLTTLFDGVPLLADSEMLLWAEYASGIVYALMQGYYSYHLIVNFRKSQRALDNYYGYSTRSLLRWMRRVMLVMTLLALGVPFLIFISGWLLKIYSLVVFLVIFYLVTMFSFYCVSSDASKVREAEETQIEEDTSALSMSESDRKILDRKVNKWIDAGGYLQSGLTIQKVADEIVVPRYQLAIWLKTTEWELFNPWLTYLRIERAKQLLVEHPDWTNDAVAHHCGFSSRNYFQVLFKKSTGMTPAQYVEKARSES
ncbi:MAG: helix-turn-helix transcriptional regulator [Prevotella sp.]|nr:helix-turn-helix transcriptional regulator [Prevotella sp.]